MSCLSYVFASSILYSHLFPFLSILFHRCTHLVQPYQPTDSAETVPQHARKGRVPKPSDLNQSSTLLVAAQHAHLGCTKMKRPCPGLQPVEALHCPSSGMSELAETSLARETATVITLRHSLSLQSCELEHTIFLIYSPTKRLLHLLFHLCSHLVHSSPHDPIWWSSDLDRPRTPLAFPAAPATRNRTTAHATRTTRRRRADPRKQTLETLIIYDVLRHKFSSVHHLHRTIPSHSVSSLPKSLYTHTSHTYAYLFDMISGRSSVVCRAAGEPNAIHGMGRLDYRALSVSTCAQHQKHAY